MTIQVREAISDTDPAAGSRKWAHVWAMRTASYCRVRWTLPSSTTPGTPARMASRCLVHCREVTSILADLRMDAEMLAAGLLSGLPLVVSGYRETSPSASALRSRNWWKA